MRKFLVPVVGALMAMLFTAGAAAAGDEPPAGPPERDTLRLLPPLVVASGEEADEFHGCLREQGVDVPEPVLEDDGESRKRHLHLEDEDVEKWGEAVEACREHLPDGDERLRILPAIPAEDLEELRERMEAFHDCLREQGVELDESDDGKIRHLRLRHDVVEDETFREAVEACRDTLPEERARALHTDAPDA